jgi:DNA-binding response OmpR family regulator
MQLGGRGKRNSEKRPQAFATHFRAMKEDAKMQMEWPRHRILVVDDEPMIRRLHAKVMMDAGYHVETAEDGVVAWDALHLKNFDLLITDHSMPKMTGQELIGKVRASVMALPVIMATGVFPEEAFARSPWLKPAAILIKPYGIAEFLDAVKHVLRGSIPIIMWQSSEIGIPINPGGQERADYDREMFPVSSTSRVEDHTQLNELRTVPEVMASAPISLKP